MTVLLWIVLLLWSLALVSGLLDLRVLQRMARASAPPLADAPEVAVVVPARNEAHQIGACVKSLLSQDWPRLKVVVVDDRSEDGTYDAAVAAGAGDARLTVVRGRELAAGWLGKNHANVQGVEAAGAADFLLFTDADTVHEPYALASAMAAMKRRDADLFSIITHLTMLTFWERALLPQVLAAIIGAYPLRMVNDPKSKVALANGQYLLIRRAVYEAVGGHAAIRDRVADDMEMARLVKSSGHRLWAENGQRAVAVRMYTSLREIWWGFVKNATAGAGGALQALGGALLVALSALPFFAAPFLRGGELKLALAGCAVALAQRTLVFATIFTEALPWALALPLGQLLFAGILAHSAARQLAGKGPRWKGRDYPHGR